MPYNSDNNEYIANQIDNQIAHDTAHAYDRERSVASKVIHAVKDFAVAAVTYVFGPGAGLLVSGIGVLLDFFFD